MTEVNDIRAGNMVMHNASGIMVTVLEVENNTVLLETFPQNSYCAAADVSGIKLTTSLLRTLSFTNEEEPGKWSAHGVSIHIKPDGFFYGLRITKNRAKLQYLHQLQNYVEDYHARFKDVHYSLNMNVLKDIEYNKA
jgi:hypothetical protein